MKTMTMAAGILSLLLAACGSAPDMTAVRAEQGKPLKRYDVIQSVAGNGDVLVAGTQDGAVLLSANGGQSWTRRELGRSSLIGLAVCPDKGFIGIDFYHRLWQGSPDGTQWQAVAIDKPRVPLAVACDGKGRWWVAGSGAKIAVSDDRGAQWRVTDLGEDAQFTTIQMVDERMGIALGEFGMVVTTQDGGATWHKTATIGGEFYPYAALFVSANEGWASGIAGQILHTQDGGKTWRKDGNATGAALYQLFLHDGKPTGVGAGGTVARYDGGQWKAIAYPDAVPVFLAAGASAGKQSLVLGGPGGLVRVIDTHKN
ncbi:hypothetical protein DLREEDagrD3_26610 [Denitratisoma sp. agr-D3]